MTWKRAPVAQALADLLTETCEAQVYERPPVTLNPPALVIGRPIVVRYSEASFGTDAVELPIVCIGPYEQDDVVDALKAAAMTAVLSEPQLGGTVAVAHPTEERNWRALTISGIDVLAVDLVLSIQA